MVIKYEVQEIKNSKGTGEAQPFIRLKQGKALTTDELADMIEEASTATKSDVLAVMTEISHIIVEQLSMGKRFYLPEVGYLSLSVGSVPPEKKSDGKITGKDIYVKNVDFQPEKKLLMKLRSRVHFEKSTYSTRSAEYSEAELWAKISEYFAGNRYITRQTAASHFGLSKYKASQWLAHFVEAGKLTKEGTPRHQLYFAAE